MDMCALSERVNWRVMPDEWEFRSLEWTQALSIYFAATSAARTPQQPMSAAQVAPFIPSKADAEAHLREIGMLT